MREAELEADEEAYLSALAGLSIAEHNDWAEARQVQSRDIFDALGWKWDRRRSLAMLDALKRYAFARPYPPAGDVHPVRIRLAGAVRLRDEVGAALAEARDHARAGRYRAAGAIAAIELERALKAALGGPPPISGKRDPNLLDYRMAAYKSQHIDQTDFEEIETLATIRKRRVHVLEREPTAEDIGVLMAGVERVLRHLEERDASSQLSASGALVDQDEAH